MKKSYNIWLIFVSAVVPWGASFILNKIALRDIGPANLAFYDWLVGSIVLLTYVTVTRRHAPIWAALRRRPWGFLALAFFFIPVPYLLQNYALQRTTVINVSLLLDADPVFVVLLGALLLRERVTWVQGVGVVVAFIGAAAVTINGGQLNLTSGDATGSLMALCAAASFSAYSVLGKVILRASNAFATAVLTAVLGTVLLLPPTLLEGLSWPGHWATATWLAVLFLGITCSAWGVLAWLLILSELDASRAAPLVLFIPLIATGLSISLLNEQPTLYTLIGATLILGGVLLSEKGARAAPRLVPPAQPVESES